ncbi:IS701 family transposase [Sphaerisporangium corydalis]|uniref:IS701 family transposase n=1 Tax=Sphaerisporangium corydalis TaxID=1441875 RepID=A0ABV9EIL5_9ACTN|nr:transposase [Sphaerisporangium corydalis]
MGVSSFSSEQEKVSSEFFARFCGMVFSSLKRRDQRRWARLYLRGLLSIEGRKTMRGIASLESGPAVEQSLQQFISQSPWGWITVRRTLAGFVEQAIRPIALVVEPLVIPKSGDHTVGVERRFVRKLGRLANCQQVVGVWLASEQAACPIDWRLILPESWTGDPGRRRRAGIPDDEVSLSVEECAAEVVAAITGAWGLRQRPVVVDAREIDIGRMIFEFSARGIPFVLRVPESIPVSPSDPRIPLGTGRRIQAGQLIDALRDVSRIVESPKSAGAAQRPGNDRAGYAVSARVHTPYRSSTAEPGEPALTLLGAWTVPEQRSASVWLTNINQAPPGMLLRIARTAERVAWERAGVTHHLGLRDFEGRSFRGWHHHVTLVSVAHAFWTLLSEGGNQFLYPTTPAAAVPGGRAGRTA